MSSKNDLYIKLELIFIPIMIFGMLIFLFLLSENLLGPDQTLSSFLIPTAIGIVLGVILFVILDIYWTKVDKKTMSQFMRVPGYVLLLIATLSLLLSNFDLILSLTILLISMGTMTGYFLLTSVLVYYRSFIVKLE